MPPSTESSEPEWVTPQIIRQIFNDSQFYEKSLSGEISSKLKRNSHPDPTPKGEPYCTHSQIVYYYEHSGKPLAIVHQYLRPDGTLGASGRPDPKRLYLGDRIISIKTRHE